MSNDIEAPERYHFGMNRASTRPLALGPIRAFEAVARHLSFNRAAHELNLTQSAVSRQIRSLEEEIGAALFLRGTRHVELSTDGAQLLRAVAPALAQIDGGVRQLRQARGRPVISVTTFASFSSMWLIPRLEAYQRVNPDIDIRVSASDPLVDLDDSDHRRGFALLPARDGRRRARRCSQKPSRRS